MELEKEVRFLVTDEIWQTALDNSTPYKEKVKMLDITCGAYGRESVAKTGKVFRVRNLPNKITLEIKNRIEGGWQEEAIVLESVEKGISFLNLAGMKPYLFIDRYREVKKFKDLKIFFDDIYLLGKYIEIEYQDSPDAENQVKVFLNICKIEGEPQPLYGEIINYKYDNDTIFREKFEKYLNTLIEKL